MRNLSKCTLTETEKKVPSKGLNFAITPRKIPQEEHVLTTRLACQKIQDQGQRAELRNTVAGILKTAKLVQSNITKEEEKAIDTIKRTKQSPSYQQIKAGRQPLWTPCLETTTHVKSSRKTPQKKRKRH